MSYVKVAVFANMDDILTYSVDDKTAVEAGCRVIVPLGRRNVTGVVINEVPAGGDLGVDISKIKKIKEVVDKEPVLNQGLLKLGEWVSDYYLSAPGIVYRSMLAALYGVVTRETIRLINEKAEGAKLTPNQKKMAEYLLSKRNKKADIKEIEKNTGIKGVRNAAVKMEEKGVVEIESSARVKQTKYEGAGFFPGEAVEEPDFSLNEYQSGAFCGIKEGMDSGEYRGYLLYGITGSGKTEVYIKAAEYAVKQGKKVIVLVPEIFLTPQITERFRATFKDRISIYHSGLKDAERMAEWKKIKNNYVDIVVGTRSAVFAPFEKTGLIIVDEEFDSSYKQEKDPRYNARDVAVYRGHKEKAAVVLGSATPSVESYYNARQGKYTMLRLPSRVMERPLPVINVIDLKQDLNKARSMFLSNDMVTEMRDSIENGEQVILFVNRRGFSNYVVCRGCGNPEKCVNCDVALVYHRSKGVLKCHYCGYEKKPDIMCKKCGKPYSYKGAGTQRVEEAIKKFFPDKKTVRIDIDSMKGENIYFRMYEVIKKKEVDILVGTQMVAKGFDFPEVTFAGAVSVDTILNLPDFRAEERVFQLLTQVAGRTGRGEKKGRVVIQTFNPESEAIKYIKNYSIDEFYKNQLKIRKSAGYPPFTNLLQVIISDVDEKKCVKRAEKVREEAEKWIKARNAAGIEILGPAPAPLSKIRNKYRYSIIFKSREKRQINFIGKTIKKSVKAGVQVIVDPVSTM